MSTQNVTDKILQDAGEEATAIVTRYQKKVADLKKEFAEVLASRRREIEEDVEQTGRSEVTRTVAQERLRFNKQRVERKHCLIDGIVEQALTTLHENKEYGKFLEALIRQSTLRSGELHINDRDWKQFGSTIERFLKKEKCQYTIVKDNALSGGVTIQQEKATHHGSLDLIRELLREELTIAVSKQVL